MIPTSGDSSGIIGISIVIGLVALFYWLFAPLDE